MKQLTGNTIEEAEQQKIDRAGMPAVGRPKRGGKLVNIIGLSTIGGVGLIFALTNSWGDKQPTKKTRTPTEEVVNRMAPLVMPDKPTPLAEPEPVAFISTAHAAESAPAPAPATTPPGRTTPSAPTSHIPTWQERKMGFGDTSNDGAVPSADAIPAPSTGEGVQSIPMPRPVPVSSGLAARLEPTVFRGARASMLPDRNYLLTKGTMLSCVVQNRLVSTLPGLAKCITDDDVYSDNSQVLLLRKGTVLTGEYSGGIKHGEARIFTLFSRIKTPEGIVAEINSPSTDALGATGIEGWVDTQFAKRFGAAIMISLLQDATALAVASKSGGGGQNTLVLGNTAQTGGSLAEKALEASVNIPPVLYVNQGAHIQVMLAGDIDFRDVYAIQPLAKGE